MAIDLLRQEFRDIPYADFSFLLCALWACSPGEVAFHKELCDNQESRLREWLKRLQAGEPAQYVAQKAWFYGLELYVDARVLIPRFDTEVLVEAVLAYLTTGDRVLDIGTGSGAIALALKSQNPQLQITATDIDRGALEVACKNRDLLNMDIDFVNADLFPAEAEAYSLIVSNPPYISAAEYAKLEPRVKDFEPCLALRAEAEGMLLFQRIIDQAPRFLKDGGILAFEHGYNQQQALRNLTESAGFETLQTGKDLAQRDRFLITRLNKSPRG